MENRVQGHSFVSQNKEQLSGKQLQQLKDNINKYEWTPELDSFLLESVVRNYFNFDMVSLELNEETKRLGLNFGATHVFTNQKARLRWSYLHMKVRFAKVMLQRIQGKEVKYKVLPSRKKNNEPPKSLNLNFISKQSRNQVLNVKSEPEKLIDSKSFDTLTVMKEPKHLGDIEKELWKKNITHSSRHNKDYLDVSNEDFSRNKTLSIDGKEITPSNFNIFRDSLRQTSEQLLRTLNENLPDMNLRELDEEEQSGDEEDDEEVLPLDFRTALIPEENKIVIQAKPLIFKQVDEEEESLSPNFIKDQQVLESTDAYLEAVKKEPFKDDDGNVILIDPDINIKEKFEQIDLACNREKRINNTINAPMKSIEQIQQEQLMQKQQQKAPISKKQYETDNSEGEEEKENQRQRDSSRSSKRNQDLDFNHILKQMGVNDLSKLIGGTSGSETDKSKKKRISKEEEYKTNVQVSADKSVKQRVGLIQSIMDENRKANQARLEKDSQPTSIDMLLASLADEPIPVAAQTEDQSDSDMAPMSSIVDLPSDEEMRTKEQKKLKRSVKIASSEDESSANEKGHTKERSNGLTSQSESESEQIDTSVKAEEQRKQKPAKKVVTYKGVKIQSDEELDANKRSSESKSDSADEYFNQQRKMIKNKLLKGGKEVLNQFDKEDVASVKDENEPEQDRDWDDDMEEFDQMMQQSVNDAERIQQEEAEKARIEAQRLRLERLRQQEELIQQEQERKRRERDELMEKVKRQDEERKRRKKEEKEKKERERERQKREEEQRLKHEQEELEKQRELERSLKVNEEKKIREKEQNEKRKETFEKSIRKIWNGSEIPCLFDSKIAYSKLLYSVPVDLENKIISNEVPYEDLKFRRYKTLLIPIDGLLSETSGRPLIEIVSYFLRYSNLQSIDNDEVNDENGQPVTPMEPYQTKKFPFKCISMLQTVALPPFTQCSLSPVQNSDPKSYRVLAMLFDIYDAPKTKTNFSETLKNTRLTSFMSPQSMTELSHVYPNFIESLAYQYFYANKLKDFQYQVKTENSPILEFANPQDLGFDQSISSKETLSRISFFLEYAIQDDVVPISTKESWDFIRRYPTFYAYNPNSKKYTKLDHARDKIISKYNQHKYENVCVVFKELHQGRLKDSEFTQQTKSTNSVDFFLMKALLREGLEVSGMRMIYLDNEQSQIYEQLFNEKVTWDHKGNAFFALFMRGVDAAQKCEKIIGHFNPVSARATNEKSLRAFFGQDKDHNCTLKMFSSHKKNISELIFWFGGRVQQEPQTLDLAPSHQIVPVSTMYLVTPSRIEKQYLFLSPQITARDLPLLVQVLANELSFSILDVQKINYAKFSYESSSIQDLNRQFAFFKLRGNNYNVEIGFIMKLSRESLLQKFIVAKSKINKVLSYLPQTFGELFYITSNPKDYKIVKQKLKQTQFQVYMQQYQKDFSQKSTRVLSDYDTEDPDNYKEISLYNPMTIKSKVIQPPAFDKEQDSYQTQSFLCFLKLSLFKKQVMNEVLDIIVKQCGFEIIGLKIIETKKEIYNELIPREVRHVFKSIAYKFYEIHPELRLRKKICELKTFVLVLRSRNIEQTLNKVYDKEKLRFIQDIGMYESTPQVLFLTNQQVLYPLFDFFLNSKMIKMYNDFTHSYEHLMDSPVFSYLLNHNVEKVDPQVIEEAKSKTTDGNAINELEHAMQVRNIVMIKDKDHLSESQNDAKLSACVVVVKPNQPMNVTLRTMKTIANNPNLELKIQNIEMIKYKEAQLELLFKHDIEYDENIPETSKERMKTQYYNLFSQAKNPVVQFLVQGPYAITKMQFLQSLTAIRQSIIGHKDPKLANKDSLRSFYGVDRVDNAYFISENYSESLIERDYLFSMISESLFPIEAASAQIQALNPPSILTQQKNQSNLLIQQHQELAIVVISPTLVQNSDFVFVLDDIVRSKFNICALTRYKFEKEDMDVVFGDLAPRFYNMDVLMTNEFSKGHSVIVVVEKEKAIAEIQEVVGRFEIKNKADFEKTKKKQSSTYSMFGYGQEPTTLVQEYGSYIFTFPNTAANQKKIIRFFKTLPNSNHFQIVSDL